MSLRNSISFDENFDTLTVEELITLRQNLENMADLRIREVLNMKPLKLKKLWRSHVDKYWRPVLVLVPEWGTWSI
jgi:hypothetical protein